VRPVRITFVARIAWTLATDAGSCQADGGASSGVDHRAKWRAVFHRDGGELFAFAAPLVDEETGRRVELPVLISHLRPDLFEPLDPRHPERACVRRTAPVLANVRDRLFPGRAERRSRSSRPGSRKRSGGRGRPDDRGGPRRLVVGDGAAKVR
jgi:hypothetical protein